MNRVRAVFGAIRDDIRAQIPTYGSPAFRHYKFIYNVLAFSGVHALLLFRASQLCHVLRVFPMAYLCRKVLYHFYHMDVWGGTDVGGGHWWCHPIGIVYSRHSRIGRRVQVFQNVSVVSGEDGSPVIEDFVILYAGACVVGKVRVGRGCVVGAYAVITRDIPDYSVVVGNPARVVRKRWREEVDTDDEVGTRVCLGRAESQGAAGMGAE